VVGHDPVGVAHELGNGQLAGQVAAGLEPFHDRLGDLDVAAVQGGLDPGQLGDVRRRPVCSRCSARNPRPASRSVSA
jgi:hypothetical protein